MAVRSFSPQGNVSGLDNKAIWDLLVIERRRRHRKNTDVDFSRKKGACANDYLGATYHISRIYWTKIE